jgi:RNA-directed DNA polymerase
MLSNGHVRCGGRAGETGREKSRNRAPARPYFSIRRYPNRKLLIKPSKAAIRRLRERLAAEMRILRGGNAMAVIAALNPVIRGWAAYYRGVVSSRVFSSLDDYLWKLTYKWATWRHANKPKRWIVGRYFGKLNKFRNDHWVFGDRDSGACLAKFSWTAIERHVPVTGSASPDDPALAGYWAERRKKVKPPLDRYTLRLLSRQAGLCPLCGEHLLTAGQPPQSPQQWERWWLQVTRRAIAASYLAHHGKPGPPIGDQTRLVHASCQRGLQARQRRKPAPQPATPSRLA